MMFSIDLLKGKGLPEKTDLKRLVLKVLPLFIPVMAVVAFGSMYHHDKDSLWDRQQVITNNQKQIEFYAKDVAEYNKVASKVRGMQKCLNDISKSLTYRIQVSEILVELVQSLPKDIFIYEMKMNRNSVNEKYQLDSGEMKRRLIVRRKLNLVLCGYGGGKSDTAVQDYINTLKQSPLLTELFTEMKHSARQQGEVDGQPAIYYEIECVLREQRE